MSRINESVLGGSKCFLSFPTNEDKSILMFPQENEVKNNCFLNENSVFHYGEKKFINSLLSNENNKKIIEILFNNKTDLQRSFSEKDNKEYIKDEQIEDNNELNEKSTKVEKSIKIDKNEIIYDFVNDFILNYIDWIIQETNKMLKNKGIIHKKFSHPTRKDFSFLFLKQDFLLLTCSEILNYSISKKSQLKNDEIIDRLYKNPEKYKLIILFLEDTLDHSIINFYESDCFKKMKSNDNINKKNQIFSELTDISLLDGYGFIEFINTLKDNKG